MTEPSPEGPPPQYGQPAQYEGYQSRPTVVVAQPTPASAVFVTSRPPDYLLPSVLSCLFCFWPTGIVAIYFAIKANTLASQGNMVGARAMANSARIFMITTIVVGAVGIAIIVIYQIAIAATYRR